MTTVAITGIGGFIGLRMAERARALGWSVRGLDLSPAAAERASALGAEVVVGSVNDAAAVRAALQGADWVQCLVHLSSVMVYGFDYPPDVGEDGPLDGQGNVYNDTKLASEQVALSFNSVDGLGVIVIRPGDVYGEGSLPWLLRPVEMLRRGLFMLPGYGGGVINHVHVDNLIDGVLLALAKNAIGEAFTISDGVATPCKDFFQTHALLAGTRSAPALPTWLVLGLLKLSQPYWRWRGEQPPASPTATRFLLRRHRYSIAKAERLLGYVPRISLEQGMAAILARSKHKM